MAEGGAGVPQHQHLLRHHDPRRDPQVLVGGRTGVVQSIILNMKYLYNQHTFVVDNAASRGCCLCSPGSGTVQKICVELHQVGE